MAKKHRNTLGLHTKEEQDHALHFSRQVFKEAMQRILQHDDRDALIFAQGYLQAVREISVYEGAGGLAAEAANMIRDLERAYHEVKT